jgi:hypothetical protein
MIDLELPPQVPSPRFALVLRMLHAAGADLVAAPLGDEDSDPTGAARILRDPVPASTGLPDIGWRLPSVKLLDSLWRRLAKGWNADAAFKAEALRA